MCVLTMKKEKVKRISISIPSNLLNMFDKMIESWGYSARSEAFRDLIRERLVEEEWKENEEVAGTVTLIYTHESHNVVDELIDFQHHFLGNIVSTMHVHLDEHNCLEVVVIKGKATEVKSVSDKLISLKGVKHGKLVMTTTGKKI